MNIENTFCTFAHLHKIIHFSLHKKEAKKGLFICLKESRSFLTGKVGFQIRKVGVSLAQSPKAGKHREKG